MPQAVFILWTILLVVTVLLLPFIIYLLHTTWKASKSIERYFKEMLEAGLGVAGNTEHVKALDDTIAVASNMAGQDDEIRNSAHYLRHNIVTDCPLVVGERIPDVPLHDSARCSPIAIVFCNRQVCYIYSWTACANARVHCCSQRRASWSPRAMRRKQRDHGHIRLVIHVTAVPRGRATHLEVARAAGARRQDAALALRVHLRGSRRGHVADGLQRAVAPADEPGAALRVRAGGRRGDGARARLPRGRGPDGGPVQPRLRAVAAGCLRGARRAAGVHRRGHCDGG